MNKEVLKKLRYQEGNALILNAPREYQMEQERKESDEGRYRFVLFFAGSLEEVNLHLTKAISHLEEDGIFWIAFPKKSAKMMTDINRNALAEFIQDRTPYRPVSNVSIDETWSALRFREKEKVKSKKS